MNEQLTGCLRYIQTVFKKFVNCTQHLLVKVVRASPPENLTDKHLAQRDGQLINQTPYSKLTVGNNFSLIKKYFAHVQRHLRLFIGAAYLLDFLDHRSIGNAHIPDSLFFQIGPQRLRRFVHLFQGVSVRELFYNNDIVFIYFRHEVLAVSPVVRSRQLQHIAVTAAGHLHNQNRSGNIRLNMQLFGTTVYVHKKQIIQKQILDKIILVKPLFISHQKILQLESRHLADGIDILRRAAGNQYIFQQLFIKNFKKLVPLYFLRIRRRSGKFHRCSGYAAHVNCRSHLVAINIQDTKLHSSNSLQPINCVLQNLI